MQALIDAETRPAIAGAHDRGFNRGYMVSSNLRTLHSRGPSPSASSRGRLEEFSRIDGPLRELTHLNSAVVNLSIKNWRSRFAPHAKPRSVNALRSDSRM